MRKSKDNFILPTHIDRYNTITLQPGRDIAYARLIAASPGEVLRLLGDYYASGNLVVRSLGLSSKNSSEDFTVSE